MQRIKVPDVQLCILATAIHKFTDNTNYYHNSQEETLSIQLCKLRLLNRILNHLHLPTLYTFLLLCCSVYPLFCLVYSFHLSTSNLFLKVRYLCCKSFEIQNKREIHSQQE